MIRLLRVGVTTLGLAGMLLAGLFGWNLWSYHRLTAEQQVADLNFERIASSAFVATLHIPGQAPRRYELHGDDWQLDARLVTWAPWMQVLGKDPIYRLDRLAGRYRDIDQARSRAPSVWALTPNPGIDLWSLARDHGQWLPGVDAAYGSAVYLPMADGAGYRISLSSHGLVARPYNADAASAISTWY